MEPLSAALTNGSMALLPAASSLRAAVVRTLNCGSSRPDGVMNSSLVGDFGGAGYV
jgi:hypothetical protein